MPATVNRFIAPDFLVPAWVWNHDASPLSRVPVLVVGALSSPGGVASAETAGTPARPGPSPEVTVEVTAPRVVADPLVTVIDPGQLRQPALAADGAELLKAVPGFALIRKGGIDGDPVLRGMGGSRLGVLVDGEATPGGCGGRMDPPTAYVFPQAYDRVQVLRGPQTVRYGPGNSAGTILFQSIPRRWDQPGWVASGSFLAGSFGQEDLSLDLQAGTPHFYGRGIAARSRSGDYQCGAGQEVHSRYQRWSVHGALGWIPGPDTRLEWRGTRSDGEAAYADRAMDGVRFLRRNSGLAFETRDLAGLVEKVEFQAYCNDIDHIMDNVSLRSWAPSAQAPEPMARNPRRSTRGARLVVSLWPGEASRWILGADFQNSRHSLRKSQRQWSAPVEDQPRVADAVFTRTGLFGEWTRVLTTSDQLIAGLRLDQWRAEDQRVALVMGGPKPVANPSAGQHRDQLLVGGFARWERSLGPTGTLFAGVGHVTRAPDYWELIPPEAAASPSAFHTRPERTTQLDVGHVRRTGAIQTSVSGFYGEVQDFILIQSAYLKPAPAGTLRPATIARNIRARTWGGELSVAAALARPLRLEGSLAYTRGENRTDGIPLAQIPPLETRLGLIWEKSGWSVGSLLRMVAPQNRYALNQGSIAGQDLGRTAGFGTLSLNAGWQPGNGKDKDKGLRISCGVDNLFDRAYAEHISRNATAIPGYLGQSTRINEPGRTLWVRVHWKLP